MLLHLLNTLPVLATCCLEIAFGCGVKGFAFDAVSAQFDRLIITLIVLLHDHLIVSIIVKILIIHYDPLLDCLLQRRVPQMINNTSMHRPMANALIRLLRLDYLLLLWWIEIEFHLLSSCRRLHFLHCISVDVLPLDVEWQWFKLLLWYSIPEIQALSIVARVFRAATDHHIKLLAKLRNIWDLYVLFLAEVPHCIHLMEFDIESSNGIWEAVSLWCLLHLGILIATTITSKWILCQLMSWSLQSIIKATFGYGKWISIFICITNETLLIVNGLGWKSGCVSSLEREGTIFLLNYYLVNIVICRKPIDIRWHVLVKTNGSPSILSFVCLNHQLIVKLLTAYDVVHLILGRWCWLEFLFLILFTCDWCIKEILLICLVLGLGQCTVLVHWIVTLF